MVSPSVIHLRVPLGPVVDDGLLAVVSRVQPSAAPPPSVALARVKAPSGAASLTAAACADRAPPRRRNQRMPEPEVYSLAGEGP